MPSLAIKTRTERLNIRVTEDQARLIRLGAKQNQANVSSFLVESACLRAEESLASERHFIYSEDQWAAFTAALDRSPVEKLALKRLLSEPSVLEQN